MQCDPLVPSSWEGPGQAFQMPQGASGFTEAQRESSGSLLCPGCGGWDPDICRTGSQPCHQKWRNEWLEKALGHPRSSEDACGWLDKEQEVKYPKDSGEAFKMSFPSDSLLTRLLTRPEALRFAVMTFKSLLG